MSSSCERSRLYLCRGGRVIALGRSGFRPGACSRNRAGRSRDFAGGGFRCLRRCRLVQKIRRIRHHHDFNRDARLRRSRNGMHVFNVLNEQVHQSGHSKKVRGRMHVGGEDQGHPDSRKWRKVLKSGKGPETVLERRLRNDRKGKAGDASSLAASPDGSGFRPVKTRPECSGRVLCAMDGLRCSDGVYPMTRNFSALVPQRGQASTPSRDLKVSPHTRHTQYCLGRALVSPFSRALRAAA